jgi:hypothetical protein
LVARFVDSSGEWSGVDAAEGFGLDAAEGFGSEAVEDFGLEVAEAFGLFAFVATDLDIVSGTLQVDFKTNGSVAAFTSTGLLATFRFPLLSSTAVVDFVATIGTTVGSLFLLARTVNTPSRSRMFCLSWLDNNFIFHWRRTKSKHCLGVATVGSAVAKNASTASWSERWYCCECTGTGGAAGTTTATAGILELGAFGSVSRAGGLGHEFSCLG